MKPISFEKCNTIYAADQPEYQPLPAYRLEDGEVISCWELSDEEMQIIIKTKKLYILTLTFNKPLQPILPSVILDDRIF